MKVSKARMPERRVFKEVKAGVVRSLVEVVILPDLFGKRPSAYIHKVYTDEDHQGRGLASALVLKAVKYAEKVGCYKVFLVCQEETLPFYARLGFQKEQVEMVLRL